MGGKILRGTITALAFVCCGLFVSESLPSLLSYARPWLLAFSLAIAILGLLAFYLEYQFSKNGLQAELPLTSCSIVLLVALSLLVVGALSISGITLANPARTSIYWLAGAAVLSPIFSGQLDFIKRSGLNNAQRIQKKWHFFKSNVDRLESTVEKLAINVENELSKVRKLADEARPLPVKKAALMKLILSLHKLNAYADVATVTMPVVMAKTETENKEKILAPTRKSIQEGLDGIIRELAAIMNQSKIYNA